MHWKQILSLFQNSTLHVWCNWDTSDSYDIDNNKKGTSAASGDSNSRKQPTVYTGMLGISPALHKAVFKYIMPTGLQFLYVPVQKCMWRVQTIAILNWIKHSSVFVICLEIVILQDILYNLFKSPASVVERPLKVWWMVRSILPSGLIGLFLIPATVQQMVLQSGLWDIKSLVGNRKK